MNRNFKLVDTRACEDEEHLVLVEGLCEGLERDISRFADRLRGMGFRTAIIASGSMLLARSDQALFTYKAPRSFTLSRAASSEQAIELLEAIFG